MRRICEEIKMKKNRTKGRGKETEEKHIEDKSGKPWRISTETWKKLVRAREISEHGLKEEILKIRKTTKREHEVSESSTPGEWEP